MTSLSLLLIEDDLVHAQMFRRMTLGISPLMQVERMDHIQTLSELPDMLETKYDGVLLDLNLPDSQGLETLAAVRAALPEVPVVVLTSSGADEIGIQAIEAGAQDFLEKGGVDRRILHRTLRYAVERHHQNRALLEAQLMQSTVLRAASSAIIAFDKQGLMLSVNQAAKSLFELDVQKLPCAWPRDIAFCNIENFRPLQPDETPLARAQNGETIRGQLYAIFCNGLADVRFVRASVTVLDTANLPMAIPVSLVLSIDDVSAEYRTRQQLERSGRLDALGQLTGGIAHDFNNILGAILPSLQLANHQSSEPQIREILEPALSATKRGANLVSRLLSFTSSPPEAVQQIHLKTCLQNLAALANKTMSVTASLELANSDLEACCDPDQLENALLNLVLNARDAIEHSKRGDAIVLSARNLQVGADMPALVEISVSDNGPGMEMAVKARAVDPFFSTKVPQHGTGLGLSMVYGFVKAAGGVLDIVSTPGNGTTVRMTLPAQGGVPLTHHQAHSPQPHWGLFEGRRILLVEDEVDLRLITASTLTSFGFEISVANCAEDALAVLSETDVPFDVLFTDIVLPGKMNGYGLARAARDQYADLNVIYMSGYTGISDAHEISVPGPFLAKPYGVHDLSDILHSVLFPDHHSGEL